MSVYDNLNAGFVGDRSPLPAGKYTDLHIVSYLGEKETKTADLKQHTFLVASKTADGTAFLKFNLNALWLCDEAIAMAFNKSEPIGSATADSINDYVAILDSEAAKKVKTLNTPEDQVEEQTAKAIENIITQIRINVGMIFRLQTWKGLERNLDGDMNTLVGTEFQGEIQERDKLDIKGNKQYDVVVYTSKKKSVAA